MLVCETTQTHMGMCPNRGDPIVTNFDVGFLLSQCEERTLKTRTQCVCVCVCV